MVTGDNELLHRLFERAVSDLPQGIAIDFDDRAISYAELNARANQIAHSLLRIGIKPNRPVAMLLDSELDQIAAMLGAIKAGAYFICLDMSYPSKRLMAVLDEAEPCVVVVDCAGLTRMASFASLTEQSDIDVLSLDKAGTPELCPALARRFFGSQHVASSAASNPDLEVASSDCAYVVYTSGSTGTPKGIAQSHRSFCQFIGWQSEQFGIRESQRVALWASIAYDASYCEIFGSLCFGATLCVTQSSTRHDPARLVTWARAKRITLLQLVPSFCRQLVAAMREATLGEAQHPLPDLAWLLLAGEALPVDLAHSILHDFPTAPRLFNLYGPSECVLATYYEVSQVGEQQRSIPIGSAIAGREILILDADGHSCPTGARGEIHVRSRFLTMGYYRRPEETARFYIQNPLHNDYADTVYKTGDLGYWLPDGTIEFCGRADNLVKLNGIRVELAEIEHALRKFSGISEVVALVRNRPRGRDKLTAKDRHPRASVSRHPRDPMAGGGQALVAYFTANRPVSRRAFRRFVEDALPRHMVPQHFIQCEAMPWNANRKLDIDALPPVENVRPELDQEYEPPRNADEAAVAEIWRQVLGVDRVGIHDSFFELGGDSLLAMQALNRMNHGPAASMTFRDLYESQTVANITLRRPNSGATSDLRSFANTGGAGTAAFPLTHSQKGLWFLWKLDPANPYYSALGSIHLAGSVNVDVLAQAWQQTLVRHDNLRVNFHETADGEPVQEINYRHKSDLILVDLTHLPYAERRSTMEQESKRRASRPFHLGNDLLLAAHLYKIGEAEFELVCCYHEILFDLWGFAVLIRDLVAVYQGLLSGRPDVLPPLEIRFRDYQRWEAERLQRSHVHSQETHWRGVLEGELPIMNLPVDHGPSAARGYQGAFQGVLLDSELSQALVALGRRHGATPFVTLLTVFNVLLHRYTGQDDLIIGVPVTNRNDASLEHIVAWFLNMLPIRTDLSGDPTFLELLDRERRIASAALSNAEFPFQWMLESLNVARDASTSPIFRVMFNWQNLPQTTISVGDLEVSSSELTSGYSKYDLALYAQEHVDRIYLHLAYLTDLFDEDTIRRMLANLVNLMRNIVASPELPLSQLKLVHDAEMHKLMHEFSRSSTAEYGGTGLFELFEQQVRRTPAAVAVRFEDQQVSYQDLHQQVNQLARRLASAGLVPGQTVAVCMNSSVELLAAVLAIVKAGAAYVPLNARFPKQRLDDILRDSTPAVLIVHPGLDRFQVTDCPRIVVGQDADGTSPTADGGMSAVSGPDTIVSILYTSSTSGNPKGVPIPLRAVLNRLHWMWTEFPFQDGDVVLLHKSLSLVGSLFECFGGLLRGVPTLILSYEDSQDPERMWRQIVSHHVTHLLATPAVLEGLSHYAGRHGGTPHSLRLVTTSAEPITPALVSKWCKAVPGTPLYNLYGSTECASNITCFRCDHLPADAVRVPIGRPIPNVEVYIVDDNLSPVPLGVVGEMCVSGPCLARGYWNDDELTMRSFVSNPLSATMEFPLFRTGDLARFRSDGNIEVVGRKDQQVNLRGFRIDPGDIEVALGRHASVRDSAVVLDTDGADRKLVAYLILDPVVSKRELRSFLEARLPDYMVPSVFVSVTALPRLPGGKIDRRSIVADGSGRLLAATGGITELSAAEEKMAKLWRDLLKVEQIRPHDHFFERGGHSLLAIRLAIEVEKTFGTAIPLAAMFRHPRVSEMTRLALGEEEPAREAHLVKLQPKGTNPPIFLFHTRGGGLMTYQELAERLTDQPVYGVEPAPEVEGSRPLMDQCQTYADDICRVVPNGPYFLGGYSFGGAVAFEVALQLYARGRQVDLLVMLDASPVGYRERSMREICLMPYYFLRNIPRRIADEFRPEAAGIGHQLGRRLPWKMRALLSEFLLRLRGSHAVDPDWEELSRGEAASPSYAAHFRSRARHSLQFIRDSVQRPYPGRITVLRAHTRPLFRSLTPDLGWRKLARGGLDVIHVPGNHNRILRDPNVGIVAKILKQKVSQIL